MIKNAAKKVSIGILLALSTLAVGCSDRSRMEASVVAFHAGITPTGTIRIVPGKGMSDGLEFATYANGVYAALASKGIVRASSSTPNYIGTLYYGIDSGHTEIYSTPLIGSTGGGSTYTTGSVGNGAVPFSSTSYSTPTFGVTGARVDSQQIYKRIVELSIRDQKTGKTIWDGRLRSSGWKSDLSAVMPGLIPVMFYEFPGPSGSDRSYSIDDATGQITCLDKKK
jgi:hypothetical protein